MNISLNRYEGLLVRYLRPQWLKVALLTALLFGGIGLLFNFASYWFSDRIALMMHRAQPVTREQLPSVYAMVERLTRKAGMPMPKLYVIPAETPNAFATGRNPAHAAVAVTEGIMRVLSEDELDGLVGAIRVSPAIERALAEARNAITAGETQLEGMPDGPERAALRQLAQYVVDRSL